MNEASDTFIYLLIYAMMMNHEDPSAQLLQGIKEKWNSSEVKIASDRELLQVCSRTGVNLFRLSEKAQRNSQYVGELFEDIKAVGCYATERPWQCIVDAFHRETLEVHLDAMNYTPDLRFRGSGYVDFGKMISWVERQTELGHLTVPSGKMDVFKRYAALLAK
ncbi:MAG TPA: hypothetical protein VJG90_09285 [Candidatus Nanoarchaeia archaeon]|nr:hypothetical protein [Candidatus Nanoarchaeia archaeon]